MGRPKAHNHRRGENKKLVAWLGELHAAGLSRGIVVLEECDEFNALREAEVRWIVRGRNLGLPLLNGPSLKPLGGVPKFARGKPYFWPSKSIFSGDPS